MTDNKVVITGLGVVSPFGLGVELLWDKIKQGECALKTFDEPGRHDSLACSVVGLVPEINFKNIPRTYRRSMSKMALFAYLAAKEALEQAGFCDILPEMGLSIGTTMGSPIDLTDFFSHYLMNGDMSSVRGATIFKIMGHGVASSLAQALGLSGRILAPSAACAAGLQAIGLGYEAIKGGREKIILCGGTEEFDVLTALTFDLISAASHNNNPKSASRPFDKDRDGLVCSEGAAVLVLESLESACARSVTPLAEIIGFATNSGVTNLVQPETLAIAKCMEKALADSCLSPADITGINAHATATIDGDLAEAQAIFKVFSDGSMVNSFKGQIGHTMAASGAMELVLCILMMKHGLFLPSSNLNKVDSAFPGILLPKEPQKCKIKSLLKNSFALGGINASLILRCLDTP